MREKLKPSARHVLAYLDRRMDNAWVSALTLPDGNGHNTRGRCARGIVLREMCDAGLIEYGKEPAHSLRGYRITPAGRAALNEARHD